MSILPNVQNISSLAPSSVRRILQAIDGADIRQRASAMVRTLERMREPVTSPDCSRVAAYFYLGIFTLVIAFIVLRNSNWNNTAADTKFHVSAYDMLERFSSLFSNANTNPLEGLFDIFPHGLRLDMIP